MNRNIALSLIALLVGSLTLFTGCVDRNHILSRNPVGPQPPEPIVVCDTILVQHFVGASQTISVAHPRAAYGMFEVPSNDKLTTGSMTISNGAGTDARCVFFLESLPGASYRRFYFRTDKGDTTMVPDPLTGSISAFENLTCAAPVGFYTPVVLYKGTIGLSLASPMWNAGVAISINSWYLDCH